ncbi:nuclear transport factor 2 family protein [Novosphingobium album (ex Hu et al. 2023)]|uniref:Nuclear transport factor 2 family protein n=1 Tax=Novosphingobium album (ex Hu et al. 2023) TaxID=2930093 RepID=A0ABT0B7F9_9SPHN|nr:nuclear transport factor 2 family protein [Novosphingobium album (ex Hu et al. 2023)]MCJ2181010.1 nuclear transport factor 2 family protein [Novosphingobium album (ex Hu et al. 2023)]
MIEFLAAEAGIRQLHARYTDAVWRKDVAAFGDCFALDAEWRLSGVVISGRGNISAFMAAAFEKYRRILLTFRNPVVSLTGSGQATARTYVSEQSVLADGTAYGPIGTYYERLVEEAGIWRFAWRLFLTEYIGPPDLSGTFFDNPDFGPPPAMPPLDEPSYDRSGILTNRGGAGNKVSA